MTPPSPTNERQREPTFFVDENLGGLFVARLRLAGLRIEQLRDHLPAGTADTDWLPYVGERGWVAVTLDFLRDDPEEQLALLMHGVPVFVLVGKSTQDARVEAFLRKQKWIRSVLATHADPFLARISVLTGNHAITPYDQLLDRYARRRR